MLQIISGKFFPGTGKLTERESHTVLFSNFAYPGAIETCVATLIPAGVFSHGAITPFVLKYTHRWESQPGGVLILPTDVDVADQFRLLASFWFQSFFYPDKGYVELLCRPGPRDAQDLTVPRQFVPNYFDAQPSNRGTDAQAFPAFVAQVIGLPRAQYKLFMSCLTTFFDALEALGANFNLAYSMYVYLLEALSKSGKPQKPTWEADYDDGQKTLLEREFQKIDSAVAANIRGILLKNAFVKAKKQFLDCVTSNTDAAFFTTEAESVRRALPKSDLKRALENLYSARSGYVHNLDELYRELQHPQLVAGADVFYWDREPHFTFSGLVRLVRHALLSFLRKQESVEKEPDCPWQDGLRGVIRGELAPQYWVAREDTFHVSQAKVRLAGFLEHLVFNYGKPMPDMRPIMPRIESEIAQAAAQDRSALLALYKLFNSIIREEDRRPNWEAFLGRFSDDMEKCGIELLAVGVLFSDSIPDWKTSEVLEVIDNYNQSKHKRKDIRLPRAIELALLASFANDQLAGGELGTFDDLAGRIILDAAGLKEVQMHVGQAKERREKIDVRVVLGWPPEVPATVAQDGQGAGEDETPPATSQDVAALSEEVAG